MLEARVERAAVMRRIFEAVRELITDVNVECGDNGIKLQAMDSSHVALVAVSLMDTGFSSYRCDHDTVLGLNLPAVCKIFKLAGPNDALRLRYQADSDSLSFLFDNSEEDKMCNFELKLMTVSQEALGIPEDESPDAVVRMPSKELATACRTLAEFNDSVLLEVDRHGFKLYTVGDMGSGQLILKKRPATGVDGDVGIDIKVEKNVKQSFALKYLNIFMKAANLADAVQLTLSEGQPLEVRFEICDRGADSYTKLGNMKFFLAPKVDTTDDSN